MCLLNVHLWNGEDSLRAYEEQLGEERLEMAGIGAMWFGGPKNQALAGRPKRIRAGNDGIIVLAATHPKMMPIATVRLQTLSRTRSKGRVMGFDVTRDKSRHRQLTF